MKGWLRRWRADSWVDDRERAARRQRSRRRLGRLFAFLGLLLIGGPGAFIGIVCSGGGSQAAARSDRAVPDAGPRRVADLPDGARAPRGGADRRVRAAPRPVAAEHVPALHRRSRLLGRDQHRLRRHHAGVRLQSRPADHARPARGRPHGRAADQGHLRRHARPRRRVAVLERHARGSLRRRDRRASWHASSAARRGSSSPSGRACSSSGRRRRCGARTSCASGSAGSCSAPSTASSRCARRWRG